jgi:CheY-like chemotaxis protein
MVVRPPLGGGSTVWTDKDRMAPTADQLEGGDAGVSGSVAVGTGAGGVVLPDGSAPPVAHGGRQAPNGGGGGSAGTGLTLLHVPSRHSSVDTTPTNDSLLVRDGSHLASSSGAHGAGSAAPLWVCFTVTGTASHLHGGLHQVALPHAHHVDGAAPAVGSTKRQGVAALSSSVGGAPAPAPAGKGEGTATATSARAAAARPAPGGTPRVPTSDSGGDTQQRSDFDMFITAGFATLMGGSFTVMDAELPCFQLWLPSRHKPDTHSRSENGSVGTPASPSLPPSSAAEMVAAAAALSAPSILASHSAHAVVEGPSEAGTPPAQPPAAPLRAHTLPATAWPPASTLSTHFASVASGDASGDMPVVPAEALLHATSTGSPAVGRTHADSDACNTPGVDGSDLPGGVMAGAGAMPIVAASRPPPRAVTAPLAGTHSLTGDPSGHDAVPAERMPYLPPRARHRAAGARGVSTAGGGGSVVLVVDDEAIVRRIMARLLNAVGVEAVCVNHGGEALAACGVDVDVTVVHDDGAMHPAATRTPFDAVFMDINMPVCDGYAATAALRRAGARVRLPHPLAPPSGGARRALRDGPLPIIAMTANVLAGDRERALRSGMDDYLAKPVTLAALRKCLAGAGVLVTPHAALAPASPPPAGNEAGDVVALGGAGAWGVTSSLEATPWTNDV